MFFKKIRANYILSSFGDKLKCCEIVASLGRTDRDLLIFDNLDVVLRFESVSSR